MIPSFTLIFLAVGFSFISGNRTNTPFILAEESLQNSSSAIYAAISTRVGAPMPEAAIRGQFIISNQCLTFKVGEDSSEIYTAVLPEGSVFISDGSTVTEFRVGNKSVALGQLYDIGGGKINVEAVPYYKLRGSIDSSCPNQYIGIGEIMSQK
jgi:hypothetical protein